MVLDEKAIFIAHAGADKMTVQGYRWEPSKLFKNRLVVYTPTGNYYLVSVKRAQGYIGFCNCPFHMENNICKHTIWSSEQVDHENADIARWDTEARDRY